jgi:HicB family
MNQRGTRITRDGREVLALRITPELKRKIAKKAMALGVSMNAWASMVLASNAACYHYSIWRYPYPQPCLVEPQHSTTLVPVVPELTDEQRREAVMPTLRMLMDEYINGEARE